MRRLPSYALALVLLGAAGCVRVRPWQRARLASPAMAVPAAESSLAVGYRSKVLESRTGGGLPGTTVGGGCGCTQ
jgi:hypothetical protein